MERLKSVLVAPPHRCHQAPPKLASALKATRPLLDPDETRSQTRHLRRLALAGAQALVNDRGSPRADQKSQLIPEHPGVRPAPRDLLGLPWIREPAVGEPNLREALAWVHGAR